MANTYEAIATQTLGSTASSVTFSSISGSYTDLILVSAARGGNATTIDLQVNGDTGANYSFTYLYGTGSVAGSGRSSGTTYALGGIVTDATSTFCTSLAYIMNYSNTTTYKTILSRYGRTDGNVHANVSLWRNTNAITSITVFPESGTTFAVGSTFSLYGIKAA